MTTVEKAQAAATAALDQIQESSGEALDKIQATVQAAIPQDGKVNWMAAGSLLGGIVAALFLLWLVRAICKRMCPRCCGGGDTASLLESGAMLSDGRRKGGGGQQRLGAPATAPRPSPVKKPASNSPARKPGRR